MLAVKSDVGRNVFIRNGCERGALGDVVLVVDFTDPADTGSHYQMGRKRITVVKQENTSNCGLIFLAVQRIRRNNDRGVVKAVGVVAVAPLAVVEALLRREDL